MSRIRYGIVGAGWRTEFFLQIAAAAAGFEVTGVVARRPAAAARLERSWGVPTFTTVAAMLEETQPSFVVVSVPVDAMPGLIVELAQRGIPVLAETPPAPDIESLARLHERVVELGARVQVAEQYWAQPHHAARLALTAGGRLGPITQAHVSVCHGYHGLSLIRRFLGAGCECPVIEARRFVSRVLAGPDRHGPPAAEQLVDAETVQYWLDFGDRLGVMEFSQPQYRNWVRGPRVCIRGQRGEILDMQVSYLQDHLTPIHGELIRHEAGRHGNLEGHYLKGIQFLEQWVYRNPLAPARLSDEEIAVGTCLRRMAHYVSTGEPFYGLAEASQDQYLALCCRQALESRAPVETARQPWAY